MPNNIINLNKSDLGFLGEDYQKQLVKCLIEDQHYFIEMYPILDQNKFTNECLRRIVGYMKDRYAETEVVATYSDLKVIARAKITDEITLQVMISLLKELYYLKTESLDIIKDTCGNFFKQQNLIRTLKEVDDIVRTGNFNRYNEIVDRIQKAIEVNEQRELGKQLFDNIESDLSDEYRIAIPTGADKLDEALYGGLAKGQLGIIISPMGIGKAQPLYSNVLTPDGFKKMGHIKIGDDVVGYDGKPHKVIGVYPQGIRPVYKITFSDGSSCECDINHLWTVKDKTDGDSNYKTLKLSEIIDNGYDNGRYIIPSTEICYFNKHKTKMKPFDYGKYIRKIATDWEPVISTEYIINDVISRCEFLKGLFNDDNIIVNSNTKITVKSLYTVNSIKHLVRTLGGTLNVEDCGDNTYTLSIDFNKKEELSFAKIEYLTDEETQCILVDSEDHLYITDDFIVTHNTSATTGFAANAAIHKCKDNNFKGWKVLHIFFEDTEVDIRRKYYGFVTNIDAMSLSMPDVRPVAIKMLNENSEKKRMLKENIRYIRMDSLDVSASDIENLVKREIAVGFKPDLVIIDYFECLAPERTQYSTKGSEWEKEGITIRRLEKMTNKYNIAMWIPVQGNRESIGLEKVGLAQGGGSIKKTQAAHIVLTFAQTDEQKTQGRMNIFLAKLRSGKINRNQFYNVGFNNGTCKFDMSNIDSDTAALEENAEFQNQQAVAAQMAKKDYKNNRTK